MDLMSQAEYARHRGVSRQAVNKAIVAGKIPLHDGKIDPAEADLAMGDNTSRVRADDEPPARGNDGAAQSSGLTRAKTFEAVYAGRMAELKFNRELGKLRPVDQIESGAQRCAEVVLRAIDRIAGRAEDLTAMVTKDGLVGARTALRDIARELRSVAAKEFATLAAAEHVGDDESELV
jgi:hypothetical protein